MKKLFLFLVLIVPSFLFAQKKYLPVDYHKNLESSMVNWAKTSADITAGGWNVYGGAYFMQQALMEKMASMSLPDSTKNDFKYAISLYEKIGKSKTLSIVLRTADGLPIFMEYNDGSRIMLLHEYYSEFNKATDLEISAITRAGSIATQTINPAFLLMGPAVTDEFPYIGMAVAYSTQSYESGSNAKVSYGGDCLVVIAPATAIKDFYLLRITEEEFCGLCDYYLVDHYGKKLRRIGTPAAAWFSM